MNQQTEQSTAQQNINRGFTAIIIIFSILFFLSIPAFFLQAIPSIGNRLLHIWSWGIITFLVPSTVFTLLISRRLEIGEITHSPILAASLLIIPVVALEEPFISRDQSQLTLVFFYINAEYICARFMLITTRRLSLADLIAQILLFPKTLQSEVLTSYFESWVRPRTNIWHRRMSSQTDHFDNMLRTRNSNDGWTVWRITDLGDDQNVFVAYLHDSLTPLEWAFGMFGLRLFRVTVNTLAVRTLIEPFINDEITYIKTNR